MSDSEPNKRPAKPAKRPVEPATPAKPGAREEPHDVLAADEFPGPSPEAAIHEQGPVELPADPQGEQPHDVLAAEEFAMPAPRHHADTSVEIAAPEPSSKKTPLLVGLAATALGAVAFALKRRSRRRSKAAQLRDRLPL
ncbi:hypothetical protein [Conexibacter sp. CPCC 206217]|uniref:hypothetical protein n=1 Tax=Conexibacter sp. CPCC 206217 TaxID=3064574 RepID=UPI002717AAE3|nr:hypothetical protein [Conexibacter sp. CPCC 206217]MDO8210902.1 hypothetical protein [Conexibacter sp. CPCC 206217]